MPLTLDLVKPKINKLRHSLEDYYCAKFEVTAITGFRFSIDTYNTHTPTNTHTHTHTHTRTHTHTYTMTK